MKRITLLLLLGLLFGVCANLQAQKQFIAQEPVLITSAGQSADILMVKILAKKSNLNFTIDKLATPEKLKDFKSVMIVCGGSTKGLGAAKIDKNEEYKRVEKLLKAAKGDKMPVIAIHVGGKSRRGALSDYFNKLVAENANHIIVVKNGNQDGFFTKIAKKNGIAAEESEKIIGIGKLLKNIYGKK